MAVDLITNKLFTNSGQNGLVSLMYHSITAGDAKPTWQWALSHKKFKEQLSLLEDYGWKTISVEALHSFEQIPPKSVIITFDDGYSDNFLAFEELAKRNMTASWFIVTRDIGKISSWPDNHAPKLKMLNKTQLIEMQSTGMSIGSHTHTHRRLNQLSNEAIDTELTLSKTILSEILQKTVVSFAYPYGIYDAHIVDRIRYAGYEYAFTTSSGFGLMNHNPLEIRRISVTNNDSLSSFARKLTFAANDVSWKQMTNYVYKRLKARIS